MLAYTVPTRPRSRPVRLVWLDPRIGPSREDLRLAASVALHFGTTFIAPVGR